VTPYLTLLNHVLAHGVRKSTRAVLGSSGGRVDALSVFGVMLRHDLSEGYPLLTTKRVSFDVVAHELCWFLSGSTNIRYLRKHGVTIWDAWADPETGDCGPIYGKQWRAWYSFDWRMWFGIGRAVRRKIDQLSRVVEDIRKVASQPGHAMSRRLLVSAWNVADLRYMALPPCHYAFQFSITNGRLSCMVTMRSADIFLGVPYNVASYALLTHLIAQVTGLVPGELIFSFGDLHLYENHVEQAMVQLARQPRPLPTLVLDPDVKCIDDFRREHASVKAYRPHGKLEGEVAV
jgi:thymidylate synthase